MNDELFDGFRDAGESFESLSLSSCCFRYTLLLSVLFCVGAK